ncbi:MAG: 2-oxo acid dehydrogenase subunit E2 [Chloroflexi bacterium]|nr:2-oxo acid dehydrogenase subunit E2 [Chloroflexota bacterium]
MAKEVIMPALGMAQETGTLLAWLKNEGDAVTKGEPLMTIATDKTDVEIEANATGILTKITAKVGDEVPVGQAIAMILTPAEMATSQATAPATPAVVTQAAASPTSQPPVAAAPNGAVSATPVAMRLAAEHNVDLSQVKAGATGKIQKEDVLAYIATRDKAPASNGNGRILASPKAKRLASEQQIDLAMITGSGPDGAVLAADVLAAEQKTITQPVQPSIPTATPSEPTVAPVQPSAQPATPFTMSRPWKIMAQRLQQSWTTVPHFYLEREANASQLVRWREAVQARAKAKITYTDLLVKLVAVALRKHPRVNASWIDENIVLNDQINVGLAVAVEEGLLVPVVSNADQLGLAAIATRRAEVVERAQAGKLTPADMSHGTFTISNLGMYGIDSFNAIVNPPQAAILAIGRIADRVVPVNGQPAVQPMTILTLSCAWSMGRGRRSSYRR